MKNSPLPILQSLNIDNKRSVQDLMAIIAASGPDVLPAAVERAYGKTGEWRGSHPLNEMCGAEYITKTVWQPLKISFPDLERRDEIIVGGRYRDRGGHRAVEPDDGPVLVAREERTDDTVARVERVCRNLVARPHVDVGRAKNDAY